MKPQTPGHVAFKARRKEVPPIGNQLQQRPGIHRRTCHTAKVSPGAAPTVLLRLLHKSGPHRIQFDVARGCQQVLFIKRKGRKPFLPQVAAPTLAEVDGARVPAMRIRDGPSQSIILGRHDKQMDMIRHKAVRPELCTRPGAPCRKQLQIEMVVAILKKRLLAAIAALRNMMRKIGDDYPCDTCHEESIAQRPDGVKFNILSPECPPLSNASPECLVG